MDDHIDSVDDKSDITLDNITGRVSNSSLDSEGSNSVDNVRDRDLVATCSPSIGQVGDGVVKRTNSSQTDDGDLTSVLVV